MASTYSCHLFMKCLLIKICFYFTVVPRLIFQIVKKPGVIIKPIQYEEVDPHQKPDEPKRVIQRVTPNQNAKKASSKQSKGGTSHKRK